MWTCCFLLYRINSRLMKQLGAVRMEGPAAAIGVDTAFRVITSQQQKNAIKQIKFGRRRMRNWNPTISLDFRFICFAVYGLPPDLEAGTCEKGPVSGDMKPLAVIKQLSVHEAIYDPPAVVFTYQYRKSSRPWFVNSCKYLLF